MYTTYTCIYTPEGSGAGTTGSDPSGASKNVNFPNSFSKSSSLLMCVNSAVLYTLMSCGSQVPSPAHAMNSGRMGKKDTGIGGRSQHMSGFSSCGR